MNSTLALALKLTAINGASAILRTVTGNVLSLGGASQKVKRDFDQMQKSGAAAMKSFAAGAYIAAKMKPGIQAAADLEEAMRDVEGSIATTTSKASDLAKQLKEVRDTGRDVSKVMPYSATEVVRIQQSLLKAGVAPSAVTGGHGAAWAAAGLASISGTDPAQVGDMLARIGTQYNFKGSDYGPAANLLMKGEAASPGSLQEVMYSLKQFGATAKMLGISFKDSVTMSAAMAPLGLESGTAINRFILDSSGLTKHQRESMIKLGLAKEHDGKFKNLLYDKGKYVGLDAQIALMREKFAGVKGDQVKLKLAHDIWGQEGMRAALMTATGDDLFGNMKKQMDESLGLEERLKIRMNGFNMATKAAAGTVQTMLGQAFDPALGKVTALANGVNDMADKAGKYLSDHPGVNKGVAVGGGLLAAGAIGFGAWQLLKAGGAGLRGVKGLLKGGGSLAAGVATGKALQVAAGVTPVFVTNMPSGGLGGAGGAAADALGAAAGGIRVQGGARALWQMARFAPLSMWGAMGAGGMATAAAGVGAAGAAGYGIGSLLYKGMDDTKAADAIGRSVAKVLAFFGNEEAKRALKVEVDVKNGNIVAAVNDAQARDARRR